MTRRGWPVEVAALLLLCGWGAAVALARLGEARAVYRTVAAAAVLPATAPPGLLPPGQAVRSEAELGERITKAAFRSRILIEAISPVAVGPRLIAADIILSGDEAAILRSLHDIEAGPPAIRLTAWRIDALPGGAVRLTGRAVAGW